MGALAMVQSAAGIIPKAMICAPSAEFMDLYAQAAQLPSVGGKSAVDTLDKLMRKNADLVQKALDKASKGGAVGEKVVKEAMKAFNYVAMEVQYNPSSMYLTSEEGYSYEATDGGFGGQPRQINTTKAPTSVTLGCELVFDAMNRDDAFMLTDQGTTVEHAVSFVQDLVVQARGGYSVEEEVNALVACLFSTMTRQVIFYWAGMSFRGELTRVSSRYTMFNKDGNPIRAHVQIEIYQKHDGGDNYDQTQFEEAFNEVFTEEGTSAAQGFLTGGSALWNPIL